MPKFSRIIDFVKSLTKNEINENNTQLNKQGFNNNQYPPDNSYSKAFNHSNYNNFRGGNFNNNFRKYNNRDFSPRFENRNMGYNNYNQRENYSSNNFN